MLTILPYAPEHAPVFDRLNRAWISELFTIEPFDDYVLKNPEQSIIAPGGEVWFAAWNDAVIGAAALLVFGPGIVEFTKLGVDESARGKGVARALLAHCEARAKARGAHTLKIFTSTKLVPACTLYRREHFIETPMSAEERTRYQRADIMFEKAL